MLDLQSETLTELVSKHYSLIRFLTSASLALAGKPQSALLSVSGDTEEGSSTRRVERTKFEPLTPRETSNLGEIPRNVI